MKQGDKKQSGLNGKNANVAIILSLFNEKYGRELLSNTLNELKNLNTKNIDLITVPGALELPVTAKRLIDTNKFDVIIALGIVIKGETAHFEHVCTESIRGLSILSISSGFPIINGILTVYNEEQAANRLDRGKEFARSALFMVKTLKNI